MSDNGNVILLGVGSLHENHLRSDQMFSVEDVVDGLPVGECDEVVVIGRTRGGQMYVGSTHSVAVTVLALVEAQGLITRGTECYSE